VVATGAGPAGDDDDDDDDDDDNNHDDVNDCGGGGGGGGGGGDDDDDDVDDDVIRASQEPHLPVKMMGYVPEEAASGTGGVYVSRWTYGSPAQK
jgi:hypothetical protein